MILFKQTSQVLEDTGVKAYSGQATHIFQTAIAKAAISIVTIEARHSAWIRYINSSGGLRVGGNALPAPHAFDTALSEKKVLAAVKKTKFIKS